VIQGKKKIQTIGIVIFFLLAADLFCPIARVFVYCKNTPEKNGRPQYKLRRKIFALK